MKKLRKKLFYILFPLIVGSIIGFITSNHIDYSTLNMPPLSPPSIIFPIVWTIIYLLMGISFSLFKQKNQNNTLVDYIYYLQLFVNAIWPVIFFRCKFYFLSLLWIVLLFIFVLWLYNLYKKKENISAYLLLPYLIWLLYAFYLNAGIYLLN